MIGGRRGELLSMRVPQPPTPETKGMDVYDCYMGKNGTRKIEEHDHAEADITEGTRSTRSFIIRDAPDHGNLTQDRPALKLISLSFLPPYAGRRVAVYSEWNLTSAGRGVAECGQ